MCDKKKVLVLGCGVIGLTSALSLQSDYIVDIWAEDLPPFTTSNKAGAYWFPYKVQPVDKVKSWALETKDVYDKIYTKTPAAGVERTEFFDFHDKKVREEDFMFKLPSYRKPKPEEIPPGYVDAHIVETFVIDTDKCLFYMMEKFKLNGGRIYRKKVNNVEECFKEYDVVVNCTGLGAKDLFNDQTVYPARGQVIVVRNKGHYVVSHDESGPNSLAYMIPRKHEVILGGFFQSNNYNLRVDEKDSETILQRCGNIYPYFKKENVEIMMEKVGLRPCRPSVRLEAESYHNGKKLVVHNYGHGGAGWSVCFGCASEATHLVQKNFPIKTKL